MKANRREEQCFRSVFDGYLEPKAKMVHFDDGLAAFILIAATYPAAVYSVEKAKQENHKYSGSEKNHFHPDDSFLSNQVLFVRYCLKTLCWK